jgi:hypothetical protein
MFEMRPRMCKSRANMHAVVSGATRSDRVLTNDNCVPRAYSGDATFTDIGAAVPPIVARGSGSELSERSDA